MKLKFLIISFLIFAFSGCGDEFVKSNWLGSEITIDGNQVDWQGKLKYLEKERSAIGFANNSEYLFVCLVTSDTGKIMQTLTTGFTIWFDPQTDSGKEFGVQYPLPMENNNMQIRNFNSEPNERRQSFPKRISQILNEQREFRILKEDLFPLTQYYIDDDTEIKVKAGFQLDQFVLELRVPLLKTVVWDYNLLLMTGDNVSVKLESGEIKKEPISGNPQGGGMGGGQRGSGMGKNGQNKGGGTKQQRLEKINFAFDVLLAKNN